MLDIVLAWGSLDGATKVLLSEPKGCTQEEGAGKFATVPLWMAFNEISNVFHNEYGRTHGGKEVSKSWIKIKQKHEPHSMLRQIVAHSHCVGL